MLSWEDQMELARREKERQRARNGEPHKQTLEEHYGNFEIYENSSRFAIYIIIMILSIFLEDRLMAWTGATIVYFMTKPKKKK